MSAPPVLAVAGLSKRFRWRRASRPWQTMVLTALDEVSFEVAGASCLGLVGESGSGKTTLARCLLRLLEPDSGRVEIEGEDWLKLPPSTLRRRRQRAQMVFQDPTGALDPRLRVGAQLAEPLSVHRLLPRRQRRQRVAALLDTVGLAAGTAERYPHQLSGGQRQRVAIARALATDPRLLVLDEAVSALDVSVQAQIVSLLADLERELRLAMVFISHDLAVVERLADRVAVLYLGRIVELAPRRPLFDRPQHPYTAALQASVPVPDPTRRGQLRALAGEVPSPLTPPAGCPFHPRCPLADERCRAERPRLREIADGHRVACHHAGESLPFRWSAQGRGAAAGGNF